MTNRQTERLIEQLVEEVPHRMAELGYTRRSCIIHTRIACDVLRAAGVRARPLAARVFVGNAEWRASADRLGRPPSDRSEWDEGAWALGIGFGLTPGSIKGYDDPNIRNSQESINGLASVIAAVRPYGTRVVLDENTSQPPPRAWMHEQYTKFALPGVDWLMPSG